MDKHGIVFFYIHTHLICIDVVNPIMDPLRMFFIETHLWWFWSWFIIEFTIVNVCYSRLDIFVNTLFQIYPQGPGNKEEFAMF